MARLSERDLQDAIDTIIGEAVSGGADGMEAVAWVIANRARNEGKPLGDVVRAPAQFEGYANPGREAAKARSDPRYRRIAEQVLMKAINAEGPDPTNGADHLLTKGTETDWSRKMTQTAEVGGNVFYRSDRAPAPAKSEAPAKKSGNTGFRNARGEDYVADIEWNGYDKGLTRPVTEVLNRAQQLVDFPIKLRSGARDPERNKAVGGASKSQHLGGNAVDISVSGLDDSQRSQLARALAVSGAKRLGAYSGNTGMHFDMAEGYPAPKGYAVYPMYDRSRNNMDRAPKWFADGVSDTADILLARAPRPADRPNRDPVRAIEDGFGLTPSGPMLAMADAGSSAAGLKAPPANQKTRGGIAGTVPLPPDVVPESAKQGMVEANEAMDDMKRRQGNPVGDMPAFDLNRFAKNDSDVPKYITETIEARVNDVGKMPGFGELDAYKKGKTAPQPRVRTVQRINPDWVRHQKERQQAQQQGFGLPAPLQTMGANIRSLPTLLQNMPGLARSNIGRAPTIMPHNVPGGGTPMVAVNRGGSRNVVGVSNANRSFDTQYHSGQNMDVYRANREAVGGPLTLNSVNEALNSGKTVYKSR